MNCATLAYWLHMFFHEWLAEQRNCSRHTVLSYRDSWRLFLRFVAERNRRPVSVLTFADLTADEVIAFLKHIESERHTSIGTRNYFTTPGRVSRKPWTCDRVTFD